MAQQCANPNNGTGGVETEMHNFTSPSYEVCHSPFYNMSTKRRKSNNSSSSIANPKHHNERDCYHEVTTSSGRGASISEHSWSSSDLRPTSAFGSLKSSWLVSIEWLESPKNEGAISAVGATTSSSAGGLVLDSQQHKQPMDVALDDSGALQCDIKSLSGQLLQVKRRLR